MPHAILDLVYTFDLLERYKNPLKTPQKSPLKPYIGKVNRLIMKILTLTLCLFTFTISFGQDPCDVESRNLITYLGSTNDDVPYVVQHLGEHGYFVGGSKFEDGSRYTYLARLNLCGEVIWQKLYNEGEFGIPANAVLDDELIHVGLYKAAAYRTSLLTIDLDGNVVDANQFGGSVTYPRKLITTSDDNLAFGGTTNVGGGFGSNDFYINKVTSDAGFIWQFRYGGTANEYCHNLIQDADGNYVAVGYTRDYIPGIYRGLILKLNPDGGIIWCKELHNSGGRTVIGDVFEYDGFYYALGHCNNESIGDRDGLLIKISPDDGEVVWSVMTGGTGEDALVGGGSYDGNIYTAGVIEGGLSSEMVISSFDTDGNLIEWTGLGTGSDEVNATAFNNFGTEVDGFYGVTGGDTEMIGGTDMMFYRFDNIEDNCQPVDIEVETIDGGFISEDKDFSSGATFWSFSSTSYTSVDEDLNEGIICTDIEFEDPPCDVSVEFEYIVNGVSSTDGATGGCLGSEIQFNDLSVPELDDIVTWEWDFGDGNSSTEEDPTHTYEDEGTYTVTLTVTTSEGCEDTYTLTITMDDSLPFEIIFNNPTCHGFSDGSITINLDDVADDITFEIRDELDSLLNEDNSNTANTLSGGWYYLSVTSESGCFGMDSIFLTDPLPLEIDLTLSDVLCYGDSSGWARVDEVLNFQGDYDAISYFWAPNPFGDEGIGADSAWALSAGEYSLTVNDENGCSESVTFTINQPDSIRFVEFGYDPAYCRLYNYQSGNGIVFAAASGGTPDFDYVWTNIETGDSVVNSTWGGLNPGTYVCGITDANGCYHSRTIYVDSLNPISDFTITSDQLNNDCQGTSPVEVVISNGSTQFSNLNDPLNDTTFFINLDHPSAPWQISHDFNETFDTTYLALLNTEYYEVCLVAINSNGCTDTLCKTITVYPEIKFVPVNIFSPNEDGVNDLFTFEFRAGSIAEFECVIVNRWGNLIYEMTSITDGWDGTTQNGTECPSGVYFYTYRVTTENSTIIEGQGSVTLSR